MSLYTYNAELVRVIDGDTIVVDWDLGARVWLRGEKLRLAAINTPELRGDEYEAGHAARSYVLEKLIKHPMRITTIKDKKGKFGRYLAFVDYKKDGEWVSLNSELVDCGHAVNYMM